MSGGGGAEGFHGMHNYNLTYPVLIHTFLLLCKVGTVTGKFITCEAPMIVLQIYGAI